MMILSVAAVLVSVTSKAMGEGTPTATGLHEGDAKGRSPNILVILADDLGYGDVQCYNPERGKIPTPNIDRLATQGMRFTDAHSSSGVCSPSRYALLTGRYHWRTRLQHGIVGVFGDALIAPDRMTLGTLAKQKGYRTATVGKWHLGWDWPVTKEQRALLQPSSKAGKDDEARPKRASALATAKQVEYWRELFSKPIPGGPTTRGFDTYFGTDVPNWPPYCFIENNRTVGIPSEFLSSSDFGNNRASLQGPALKEWKLEGILPALGDRAAAFIADAATKPEPFLLYMPLTSPHTPLAVLEPWKNKSGLNLYADFVMQTDATVGRVLDALEKSGTAGNTLVVFTSDNGCAPYVGAKELEDKGHFPSGPLRGYKADAWEGGHRIPFIVRWPGVVKSGSQCRQLVAQADLLRTFADIFGTTLPDTAGEDSFSILPLLRGEDKPIREHAVSASMGGVPAVRLGTWKYIAAPGSGGWGKGGDQKQPVQLYNLADDLGETNNIAAAMPEKVEQMKALLEKLITDGRSTPGAVQKNDVEVKRFPAGVAPTQTPTPKKESSEKYSWTLGFSPDKSISFYAPEKGDPLKLDIFFPKNHTPAEKRGCIVFFFGGGWSGGGTEQFYGYAKYLASRGLVAISAQYRTKSSHKATPRECVEDGKRAIRYVREHAKELGVDPDKIIAGGGSAGGHVVAACAMCPKIDAAPDSAVSCVPNALVLFNPVYDNGPGGYGHDRVTEYWKDISPFHNIRKGLPPAVVFFGSHDACVPVATVKAFEKQMTEAGNTCETHIYDGEEHGFFHISKGGRKMFEDVLGKADAFLVKHGYLTGPGTVAGWTAKAIENQTSNPAKSKAAITRAKKQKQ